MFVNKLRSQSEGALKYWGKECHRLEIWDMEKMMGFVGSSSGSKHLAGMPADMQLDHGISSVHAQCFSH